MDARYEIKTFLPLTLLIPIIILVEGFVSIAIEILTIRQLLPFAGSNIVVTSLVIGFFLLFLALGYKQGGQIEKNLQQVLRINFLIAAIWLGLGLSFPFLFVFLNTIQKIMGPHIVYPLIAYLLIVISPLIFLLGQTLPITMNLVKRNQTIGAIGGNTLGLSTIGSFLGAILTTLVLMNFLGVAWTVFISSILLLILYVLLCEKPIYLISQLLMIIGATLLIYSVNIIMEKSLFILTNNYANYQIYDSHNSKLQKNVKLLVINNADSSSIDNNNKACKYIENIKRILFRDLKLKNSNILVLGAGGFTLSAENTFQNRITYVDIDKNITRVVIPRFIKKYNGSLIIDDARHFLHQTNIQYDAIIVDAYSNTKSAPSHLLTREYMLDIKKRLTVNGIAILNILAKPTLSDPFSKHIDNTIRSVFQNCMISPSRYGDVVTNILYICDNLNNQTDNKIYSDNLNTSSTEHFEW